MYTWKKILGVLLCLVVICSMASMAISCDEDEEEEELNYTITKTATAKDAAGNGVVDTAGEIIEYTVEVENTGNTTITGVGVSDSLSITLTRQDDDPGNDDTDLEEGEIWVYTGSYTVQQSDLDAGSIENTAIVSSNELGDKSDTEEVTIGFADDTVKIGVILPLTGMIGAYGEQWKAGIDYVLYEMEAEGALNGADIEVIWADDGGDPNQSASEMTRLCTTEGVCAVIGPFSPTNGLAACPLADTYQIPNIGLAVTGQEFETLDLQYWRTIVPERESGDYGRSFVDFTKYCIDNYDLPHDRIVVATINDSLGVLQRASILERLEEYGLDDNVVFDLQYDATATTYATEALQCKNANPDIFLALTLPLDLAIWVKAMQEQEFYPPFMVTSSTVTWDSFTELFVPPDIYNEVFNDEHTAVFSGGTVFEDIPIDSVRNFADRYADYCEAEGITNRYEWAGVPGAAQAMYCLWYALEEAGSADPEKINDALRGMVIPEDDPHFVFPTLAPAVEWNSNGTLKNYSPFMTQIQDGVEVMVWPEELQQADPLW